jgi:hypothetical protein
LECSFEVLFHPSVIERFILVSSFSAPTQRTVRTILRFIAKRALRTEDRAPLEMAIGVSPPPVALSRERAKAPYTDSEVASYLALADAQRAESLRLYSNPPSTFLRLLDLDVRT